MSAAAEAPAGRQRGSRIVPFLVAAVLATAVGSIVQTQFNLAALRALGVDIPLTVRLQATLHDLGSFAPAYAVIVVVALVVALWAASRIVHLVPGSRLAWYAAAGFVGLLVAFLAVDALTPVPGFIAATRTAAGTLAMTASGAVGGWLYARMTRVQRHRAVPGRGLR